MGQITATRNLVAIKVVRHAGQYQTFGTFVNQVDGYEYVQMYLYMWSTYTIMYTYGCCSGNNQYAAMKYCFGSTISAYLRGWSWGGCGVGGVGVGWMWGVGVGVRLGGGGGVVWEVTLPSPPVFSLWLLFPALIQRQYRIYWCTCVMWGGDFHLMCTCVMWTGDFHLIFVQWTLHISYSYRYGNHFVSTTRNVTSVFRFNSTVGVLCMIMYCVEANETTDTELW